MRKDECFQGLETLMSEVHETAVSKGWWPSVRAEDVPKGLMLMVSELAEALEEFRNGSSLHLIYLEGEKPCGYPVELADALIRILDHAKAYEINLANAVRMKMKYNETRSFRHGGKAA